MNTARRAGTTLALVAIGGSGLWWQTCEPHPSAERRVVGHSQNLPDLRLTEDAAWAINRVELTRPGADEEERGGDLRTITLEKLGDQWEITSPIKTRASGSKVASLIKNLMELSVVEAIESGTSTYDVYELTEPTALHAVAWRGHEKVSDLYFGRTGPRGRTLRIAGTDGVFAVTNSGAGAYSGFLYTRDVRGWRETSILEFNESAAIGVEVTNKNGRFSFFKDGRRWLGSFTKQDPSGKRGAPELEWAAFDGSRVDDLLRAYRSLSADDFGEENQREGSGVDNAEETGGLVRISLGGGAGDRTIRVGKLSTNDGRWAIHNSRWAIDDAGDGTLYILAPWTADWATADARKFESAEGDRP